MDKGTNNKNGYNSAERVEKRMYVNNAKSHKYHLMNNYLREAKVFGDISLFQIGLMHCEEGCEIEKHLHGGYYELTVVVDGEGTATTNNDAVSIGIGDVHLSYPFETHGIVSSVDKPLKYLFCAFNSDDRELAQGFMRIAKTFSAAKDRIFRSHVLTDQIEFLLDELTGDETPLHDKLLQTILNEIALVTVTAFKKRSAQKTKISKSQEFCYQIMSYINNNITSITTLQELSDVFGYNYFYISKTFKKTVGQTLQNYYKDIRLQTAKNYLDEKYNCTEIAEILKFSSVYSFSKSFKQTFGISPAEYKKSGASKQNATDGEE